MIIKTNGSIMLACINRLQIDDCKFFGCDWLMSPNQDETSLSLPKACGLIINPFAKLELVSRRIKVKASALKTFADVFCWKQKQETVFIIKKVCKAL